MQKKRRCRSSRQAHIAISGGPAHNVHNPVDQQVDVVDCLMDRRGTGSWYICRHGCMKLMNSHAKPYVMGIGRWAGMDGYKRRRWGKDRTSFIHPTTLPHRNNCINCRPYIRNSKHPSAQQTMSAHPSSPALFVPSPIVSFDGIPIGNSKSLKAASISNQEYSHSNNSETLPLLPKQELKSQQSSVVPAPPASSTADVRLTACHHGIAFDGFSLRNSRKASRDGDTESSVSKPQVLPSKQAPLSSHPVSLRTPPMKLRYH
ncbi:hypothetical protein DFJ77DRAFT_84181 [Powellomyces hirtus]|nr:hypothetical protein DFJ77DRAFT_84181 [Powellomyces hirtus]